MHNILRYYTVAVKYRMNIVFAENQKSIFNVKIVVKNIGFKQISIYNIFFYVLKRNLKVFVKHMI